jgi:hypothetical protein
MKSFPRRSKKEALIRKKRRNEKEGEVGDTLVRVRDGQIY